MPMDDETCIRPHYRNDEWIGWKVLMNGRPIGRVFEKHEYLRASRRLDNVRDMVAEDREVTEAA